MIITAKTGDQEITLDFELKLTSENTYEISINPDNDIPVATELIFNFDQAFLQQNSLQMVAPVNVKTDSEITAPEDSSDEDSLQQESTEQITSAVSAAALVVTGISAAASGEYVSFWRLVNTLQILVLFNFVNIETDPVLKGFLGGLLKDERIPNLYAYFGNKYDDSEMPNRFTEKFKYPSFLDIAGHVFTIWVCLSIVACLVLLTLK